MMMTLQRLLTQELSWHPEFWLEMGPQDSNFDECWRIQLDFGRLSRFVGSRAGLAENGWDSKLNIAAFTLSGIKARRDAAEFKFSRARAHFVDPGWPKCTILTEVGTSRFGPTQAQRLRSARLRVEEDVGHCGVGSLSRCENMTRFEEIPCRSSVRHAWAMIQIARRCSAAMPPPSEWQRQGGTRDGTPAGATIAVSVALCGGIPCCSLVSFAWRRRKLVSAYCGASRVPAPSRSVSTLGTRQQCRSACRLTVALRIRISMNMRAAGAAFVEEVQLGGTEPIRNPQSRFPRSSERRILQREPLPLASGPLAGDPPNDPRRQTS